MYEKVPSHQCIADPHDTHALAPACCSPNYMPRIHSCGKQCICTSWHMKVSICEN